MAKSKRKKAEKDRKSASEVWLAGLGALSIAQEEGSKLFESLVKEGEAMQARSKKLAKKSKKMTDKATEAWDKVEHIFEERVSHALNRLALVKHQDMEELTKRIEQLEISVKKLTEPSKPTTKRRTSKRTSTSV